ncbi:hypothetical protein ABZS86_12555 [Streptomyces sp. NPDC005355]|uniref:hypothetical protein n=1 Tax=Streptomyces sp. NPDC005355 TaxID=3157038 RepID=UPI0033B2D4FC
MSGIRSSAECGIRPGEAGSAAGQMGGVDVEAGAERGQPGVLPRGSAPVSRELCGIAPGQVRPQHPAYPSATGR